MKRLILSTVCILLCATGSLAQILIDGIYYNLDESTQTASVTGGKDYSGSITIPSSVIYNGTNFSVTSIEYNAFAFCSNLTSVTIPNSVTSIGSEAFSGCYGLTNITIGEGVENIGYKAFNDCSNLVYTTYGNAKYLGNDVNPYLYLYAPISQYITSCEVNSNCKIIADYAFQNCNKLTSVKIGEGVTSVGIHAFSGCSGLTSIEIPNSVTSIKGYAFYNCTGLKEVVNESALEITKGSTGNGYIAYYADLVYNGGKTVIGDFIFSDRDKILVKYTGNGGNITLPENFNGGNYVIGQNAFYGNSRLTSVTIPNSVTSIGDYAFSGCSVLASVTIPNSVTSIGDYAFSGCSVLASVTIPNSVTNIGVSAFYNCSRVTSVTIPNGVTSIGNSAFKNCSMMTNITIGESVTNIGESAFYGNSRLANVTIPNSVTSIGNNAFRDCGSLTNITIGESVISIGKRAFENCSRVTSIMIPNSVTSIGEGAFENCSSLTNLTIGESVISISSTAFHSCNGLKSIIWNAKNYPSDSYYSPFRDSKTQITKLVIGENVTSIPSYLCHEMSGLKSIVIPNSVTSIGSYAFDECRLSSIIIPNSVTSIGDNAFYKCTGLKEVINKSELDIEKGSTANGYVAYYADYVCNGGKTVIGDFIFSDRDKTLVKYTGNERNITLPENFNGGSYTIGASAFSGNTTLTSITIPNSVASIGEQAFYGCTGLTSITIPNSVTSIGEQAFYGCTGLTSITIPNSVTSIGEQAFYGCANIETADINSQAALDVISFTDKLTSINLGSGITNIRSRAFYRCTGLTSVTIPSGVTSIGSSAFYSCTGLKEVINKSALNITKGSTDNGYVAYYADIVYNGGKTVIGDFIFSDRDKTLVKYTGNGGVITLPENFNGDNYIIKDNVFSGNSTLTSVTIPNSVTSIGEWAFSGCSGLASIEIPSNVKTIERGTFSGCSGLTNITIPNSVTSIEYYAFEGCDNIETAVINSQTALTAINFTDKLSDITFGDEITSIENSALSGCGGLTNINVVESNASYSSIDGVLYSKDQKTLIMCPKAKTGSITIPNSVTSIGNDAFFGCNGVTNVTIGDGVTSIGDWAFSHCTGLTSITIPNSVTSIGDGAFDDCSELTSVTIGEGVTSIGDHAFQRCIGLTNITIPNSVISIGISAFSDCSGLTSINVDCKNYDYIKNAISEYEYITHIYCALVITTNVNNEDYGTVTGGGTFGKEPIQLTAVPNEHYHFVKWSDGNTENPRTVQVTQDSTFTAMFAINEYNVTADKNISAAGTVTGSGVYKHGTSITLTAAPNDHYYFVKWDDGNTENPRTVQVTQDSTFTAMFAIDEHNITVSQNSATGTVTGEGVYEYGTSITLTAVPNDHYHFVKWNDGNTDNPRTVKVTQDSTFAAMFAIDEHNVTISKNIPVAGTVTGEGIYKYGTNITLTATVNDGYRFKGWSDGAIESSREITVTKDIDITANFVTLYTLKTMASVSQGTASGDGVYEDGEIATLVANAKPGYVFAQWADGNDENPRYVTVDGNKTYTAIFIEGDPDAATATPEAEESIVETARYDINGRPLTAPTKGVNIVKYSDGSFEKEFVR